MSRAWWRHSAREVDTLSWLTSSLVSISVAFIVAGMGMLAVLLGGQAGNRPVVQVAAVAIMCAAAIVIHLGARPSRASFSTRRAVLVYALIILAVAFSAAGYTSAPALFPAVDGIAEALLPVAAARVDVELWWAPACAALVIMASSPFVPGRVFVPGAAAVALSTGVTSTLVALSQASPFPGADSMIATSTVVFAIIGGSVLSRTLILSVEGSRTVREQVRDASDSDEPVTDIVDRITEGRFSAHVVPFLERIESAETITTDDRQRAAQLAEEVRGALVVRGDQSWLAVHMTGRPVAVTDPFRLADTITLDQRAAIIALIDGLFSDPDAGVFGARLDLAPAPEDAVAVAVTVGLALPEGRRTSVLAPYYLSVKSVVRRIEWRGGESLVVAFDVDSASP